MMQVADLLLGGEGELDREGGLAVGLEKGDMPAVAVHELHEDAVGGLGVGGHGMSIGE